jgi:hypothetical protein
MARLDELVHDLERTIDVGAALDAVVTRHDRQARRARATRFVPVAAAVMVIAGLVAIAWPGDGAERLGVGSGAPVTAESAGPYYRADVILEFDDPTLEPAGGHGVVTLQEAAFWLQMGDLPIRVAAELETSPESVRERVRGVPLIEVNALAVSAIGTERVETEQLAQVMASHLVEKANAVAVERYDERIGELQEQLEEIEADYDELLARIAAGDPAPEDEQQLAVVEQQLAVVEQRRAQIFSSLEAALRSGPPANVLTVVEHATANEITAEEYRELRRLNQMLPGSPADVLGPDEMPWVDDGD